MKKQLSKRIVTIFLVIFVICLLILTIGGIAMAIEHLSIITTPVILLKGDQIISQGTGFYYGLKSPPQDTILFLGT